MAKKEPPKVEVITPQGRFAAILEGDKVVIMKDGAVAGRGRWADEQILDCSAIIPDDVYGKLEKAMVAKLDEIWRAD